PPIPSAAPSETAAALRRRARKVFFAGRSHVPCAPLLGSSGCARHVLTHAAAGILARTRGAPSQCPQKTLFAPNRSIPLSSLRQNAAMGKRPQNADSGQFK